MARLSLRFVLYVSLFMPDIFCQSTLSTSVTNLCPGNDVMFTCETTAETITWDVTSEDGTRTVCVVVRNPVSIAVRTCGPMDVFSVAVIGDGSSSTLTALSVNESLNGTVVDCTDGNVDVEICVVGDASAPQNLSVEICEPDMCNSTGCTLCVNWEVPVISCNGSVSQYVLTVTPPTCDCQSSPHCMVVDNSAVYTIPGSETQYNVTVNGSVEYSVTVRADTCGGNLTGDSLEYSVNLTAVKRSPQPFQYHYVYNIMIAKEIDAISVSWPRVDTVGTGTEATYSVVITSESRKEVIVIETGNCTGDSCSYTFFSGTINDSYFVAVEVVGCTTERINASNMSTLCPMEDLRVMLPGSLNWSELILTPEGLGVFSFAGGNVTFNGVSLGSTATYMTAPDYRVSGDLVLVSSCVRGMWTPPAEIIKAECRMDDLLSCNRTNAPSDDVLCCDDNAASICVRNNGTAIGSMAVYTTPAGFCITTQVVRTCRSNLTWDGQKPTATKASTCSQLGGRIPLIVIGVLLFFTGLMLLVVEAILLYWRVKIRGGTVKQWYWAVLVTAMVLTVICAALWVSFWGYTEANEFSSDGGPCRRDDSSCKSVTGKAVRDGLLIASFVLSIVAFLWWLLCLVLMRWAVTPSTNSPDGGKPSQGQELDTYSHLTHGSKPTSPQQSLLSDSDPAYGKLHQSDDEPGHYGKLDRVDKKPPMAAVAPTGDSEYGKLDRSQVQEEPGHYGKLDHPGVKTSTLPVNVSGTSEYGKLDRSTMEDPLHYGKLDHPGKKGATLPGEVPPDGEGYGKLDRTQMQVAGGAPGDVYDTVTDAPRHVPKTHSKSRRQTGEEASLL